MYERDKIYKCYGQLMVFANYTGEQNVFELLESSVDSIGKIQGTKINDPTNREYFISDYKPLMTDTYWFHYARSINNDIRLYEPQETSGLIYEQYIRLKRMVEEKYEVIPTGLKTKFIIE